MRRGDLTAAPRRSPDARRRRAPDVFVRRVGARAHERVADVDRIALVAGRLTDLRDRAVEIGRVWPDHMRLELVEIDLDTRS